MRFRSTGSPNSVGETRITCMCHFSAVSSASMFKSKAGVFSHKMQSSSSNCIRSAHHCINAGVLSPNQPFRPPISDQSKQLNPATCRFKASLSDSAASVPLLVLLTEHILPCRKQCAATPTRSCFMTWPKQSFAKFAGSVSSLNTSEARKR